MQKENVNLPQVKLVGLSVVTNNKDEFDPKKAKIGKVLHEYHSEKFADKIMARKKPNVTYCVYCKYDTDENGDYTYFVGEEVDEINLPSEKYDSLIIPQQKYCKFEVGPGKMPDICIDAWKEIWQMGPADFGSDRVYIADFEIYDNRAADLSKAIFDIYIGLK